jgi:thiaminase (transcriptional activator TenA)
MAFVDELMGVSRGIWEREKEHPFVRGLGDGSLSAERFRFYLEQDYLYLIEYAKVFALAVTRSPELDTMAYFAQLCTETLNTEMALHRSYCAEFGLTPAELEAAEPAQTTVGYTGHLLQVAVRGGIADIIAAVLPCQWGYVEIARHLQARGMPPEPRYRKWIELYTAPAFDEYGRWLRARLEALAPNLAAAHRARLRRIFHTSSRWEYLFWEMAWRMERWSVPED